MANIVITQTGNSLKLVYNTQTQFGVTDRSIKVNNIVESFINGCVELHLGNGTVICLTGDSTETDLDIGIVDSVIAVSTPTNAALQIELDKILQ